MIKGFLSKTTLIWALVVGIFLNLAYIAYMAFWPFPTVDIYSTHPGADFQVTNPQPINPGDVLVYKADYCRYTEMPATVVRTIVGPTIITLVNDQSSTEKGCRKVDVKNTVIPGYTPPGIYHMKITACYQVNPIRNICHYYKTTDFEVK